MTTDDWLYPFPSEDLADERKQHAPEIRDAFLTWKERTFADGALSAKMKQLIAVAAAHVTQCPYCIRGHVQDAVREGATRDELMEAIWVAAAMRAGGAYAFSLLTIDELEKIASEERVPEWFPA